MQTGNGATGSIWHTGGCAQITGASTWNCNPGYWGPVVSCDVDPIDCSGPYGPGDETGPCIPLSSCVSVKPDPRHCAITGVEGNDNRAVPYPKGSKSLNALIRESTQLSGLFAQLAELSILPAVQLNITADPGTWRGGEPAEFDLSPNGPIIVWNSGDVSAAMRQQPVAQDPTQILFHEADHDYYDFILNSQSLDPVMSVVIDGQTYNYTIYTVNPDGSVTPGNGIYGYEHALIDDDIKSAFGTDTTAAEQEALQQANNPPLPENIPGILQDTVNVRPTFKAGTKGSRPIGPDLGTACPSTSTTNVRSNDLRVYGVM
jgi:hypothetical protein